MAPIDSCVCVNRFVIRVSWVKLESMTCKTLLKFSLKDPSYLPYVMTSVQSRQGLVSVNLDACFLLRKLVRKSDFYFKNFQVLFWFFFFFGERERKNIKLCKEGRDYTRGIWRRERREKEGTKKFRVIKKF